MLGPDAQAALVASGHQIENVWTPNAMQERALLRLEDEVGVLGGKYGGKASALSALIVTPYGLRAMRDIKVGSVVSNPDGGRSTVIAVHPQGVQKIWKVRFADGSETRVTGDHLWVARWNAQKWKGKERTATDEGWRICTTAQMIERMAARRRSKNTFANTFQVPLTAPIEFNSRGKLPIDPYLLGVLLGDGSLGERGVRLTCADPEIVSEFHKRSGEPLRDHGGIAWGAVEASGIPQAVKALGLAGKRSWEKEVPSQYLFRSSAERWELLAGLMDTDGTSDSRGHCSFCSVSEALAKNVQWLVRSLGGNASITQKRGGYRDKAGESVECREAYTVHVNIPDLQRCFHLSRKRKRCAAREDGPRWDFTKNLESITEDGEEDAQCIQVDHPNSLYVADDFIVTHNTEMGRMWLVGGNPHLPDYDADGGAILVNQSYVYHPRFLGVVIRLNEKDLAEWVDRAIPYYEGILGGTYTKNPAEFRWPSGARVFLGHAQDASAWTKYQGQNIVRFLIEEAGQIPDIDTFDKLRSCCRSLYEEMRAQIMLTANPGGKGQCVPFGEVLTPSGWRDIAEFSVGDPVYTVDSSGEMAETVVAQVHKSHYSGDMIQVQMRGFSMTCTPNHKIAKIGGQRGKSRKNKQFSLVPFEDLPGQASVLRSVSWAGTPVGMFQVPFVKRPIINKYQPDIRSQPQTLSGHHFCEFMGWFLSEGCVLERDSEVTICQKKPAGRRKIAAFLKDCGFQFREHSSGYTFASYTWTQYLKQFGKCRDKFIPEIIKNGTTENLLTIITSLMDGDGHWSKRGSSGEYYTISRRLADDVAEILVKAGFIVYLRPRQRPNRNGLSYEVSFRQSKTGGTEMQTGQHVYDVDTTVKRRNGEVTREQFDGTVYCLGIEGTHTFVLRQNGSVWVSGNSWIFDRFIEPKDRNGIPILHPTALDEYGEPRPILESDGGLVPITEKVANPFTGEEITSTRVWVPSYLTDNPHALRDTKYIANLATMQDEKLRRAYLFGDWRALRGTYFDIFHRRTHTYDPASRPLASWWRSSGSLDWGFAHESAVYFHKMDPETKQNLVYKEFVTNRTDPIELGAEMARQAMPELRVQGSITLHVSHDLYQERIGEFSWVELIGKGVQRILGEGTCYIPEVIIKRLRDNYQIQGKEWDEGIEERILNKEISGIVFRRAPKSRAVGFMYLRSLMRMDPLIAAPPEAPNWDIALQLSQEGSIADYATYLNSFKREAEILPQLLISQACPRLIEAIPKAIHSEEDPDDIDKGHFLGYDSLDSLRYLMSGIREQKPSPMPRQLERERQLSEARRRNPELTTADMIWIARGIEDREAAEDGNADGFCLGRGARGARYRSVEDVM